MFLTVFKREFIKGRGACESNVWVHYRSVSQKPENTPINQDFKQLIVPQIKKSVL